MAPVPTISPQLQAVALSGAEAAGAVELTTPEAVLAVCPCTGVTAGQGH